MSLGSETLTLFQTINSAASCNCILHQTPKIPTLPQTQRASNVPYSRSKLSEFSLKSSTFEPGLRRPRGARSSNFSGPCYLTMLFLLFVYCFLSQFREAFVELRGAAKANFTLRNDISCKNLLNRPICVEIKISTLSRVNRFMDFLALTSEL